MGESILVKGDRLRSDGKLVLVFSTDTHLRTLGQARIMCDD